MSAPAAADRIAELIEASVEAFSVCSAVTAAGAPGVPAAASVAASAVFTAASAVAFAETIPAAAPVGIPRHGGRNPMSTFGLPGPGCRIGGNGWATGSSILAAGPVGISTTKRQGTTGRCSRVPPNRKAFLERKRHQRRVHLRRNTYLPAPLLGSSMRTFAVKPLASDG